MAVVIFHNQEIPKALLQEKIAKSVIIITPFLFFWMFDLTQFLYQ